MYSLKETGIDSGGMAGPIARLQATVDHLWEIFHRFPYPRTVAFIFEGALIGSIGWLLLLASNLFPGLTTLGRVTAFIGGLTFVFGIIAYIVFWVNAALNERLT